MRTKRAFPDTSGLVGFDFDGTIVSEEIAREANRRWFAHYAEMLGDPSVRAFAEREYQQPVLEVMARLHGKRTLTDEDRVSFLGEARDAYAVFVLELVATTPCRNDGIVTLLRDARRHGYRLALISASAPSLVEPALALLGLRQHFDVLVTGTRDVVAAKRELLERFVREHGPLLCYVGNSAEDREACGALSIPFVHCNEDALGFSFRISRT